MTRLSTDELLAKIRRRENLTASEQTSLVIRLSVPAVLAEISTILMEYIDAAMVGHLGAQASAAVSVVMPTLWLFWGMAGAVCMGFSVQAAHRIGADDLAGARSVLRQALVTALGVATAALFLGVSVSRYVPVWLGAALEVCPDASAYFGIFALGQPFMILLFLAGGMLRSAGDMKTPSVMNVALCFMDVVFNWFFIFPVRDVTVFGLTFSVWGAGLGVEGAAWGTFAAQAAAASVLLWQLCARSPLLKITHEKGRFMPTRECLKRAVTIGLPVGVERFFMCSAQIVLTMIVAPLGTVALAAHGLATSAESLCYMPGYGVSEAATTMVGQSLGAGRKDLARRMAWLATAIGVGVMTLMGAVMYFEAPLLMQWLSSDAGVVAAGSEVLRIEAFAEPLFAASIVAYGAFVGAGDTLVPCLMNLGSMWAVRLSLAFYLAPLYGLKGVWIAMAAELSLRGSLFLLRLRGRRWMQRMPTAR